MVGDLTDVLLAEPFWTDELVDDAGIPVLDVPVVTVGGGIGSFVFVDYLRIAGVAREKIKVLSAIDKPWVTYQHLATISQIPPAERLRSDSGSCPDNIWGFPSYAARESYRAQGLTNRLGPLWNVLTEPILTRYFTPRAGQVIEGMEREADRIGWWDMVDHGQVRITRRREGGGYFTLLTPPSGTSETKRVAYRSQFVHLAIGYPGLRLLPDLQEYRERTEDYAKVVSAYEPHEHLYEEVQRRARTVMVRGGGITASRILNRLIDDRDYRGSRATILHLFGSPVFESRLPALLNRRLGSDGWVYQGFNWPKAGWGGQIKVCLEKLEGEERKQVFDQMGRTSTPKRRLWTKQLARGRNEGWYKCYYGDVVEVRPGPDHSVLTRIKVADGILDISADFVIDATGLEADIRDHRVLNDLLDFGGARTNVLGKLDVDQRFEVSGTRNGEGRMYAVGSATLGSYYTAVDSFLGLQYAGLQVCDDLARQGFCHKIGPVQSIRQWWNWVLNRRLP